MKSSRSRSVNVLSVKTKWALGFGCLFLIHFLRVLQLIPLKSFTSETPLIQGEHLMAYTESKRYIEFKENSGQSGGIDHRIMGGVPVYPLIDSDRRLVVVFSHAVRKFLSPLHSTKIILFLLLLLPPFLIFFSVRRITSDNKLIFLILALTVAGFANYDFLSTILIRFGHEVFVFSNYLTIYVFSLIYSLCEKVNRYDGIRLSIGFSFLFLAQGLAFGITLFCFGAYIIYRAPKFSAKYFRTLVFSLIICVVFNLFWISDVFRFSQYYVPPPFIHSLGIQWFIWPLTSVGWSSDAFVRLFLLGGVLFSLVKNSQKRDGWEFFFYFWAGLSLLVGMMGHNFIWGSWVRPERFLSILSLALIFPAAKFLRDYFWNPKTIKFFLVGWVLFFQLTWPLAPSNGIKAIETYYPPAAPKIADWLKDQKPEGRVLVEDTYAYFQMNRLLPFKTDHDYLGFTTRTAQDDLKYKASFNSFNKFKRPKLFGWELAELNQEGIVGIFNHYKIGLVLAFTEETHAFFSRWPSFFVPVEAPKEIRAYRFKKPR